MILIVSGGDDPGIELIQTYAAQAEQVIAADRGAAYCLAAGVLPDLLVGDMDSLDEAALNQIKESGCAIREFSPHKDQSDTQIALDEAVGRGAAEVVLLAASGDRFDHTLANVQLLKRAHDAGVTARLVAPQHEIFLVTESCELNGCAGVTVSLLPLTNEVSGVTLSGFEYGVQDAQMRLGEPYGISNICLRDGASVRVAEGILLVIITQNV